MKRSRPLGRERSGQVELVADHPESLLVKQVVNGLAEGFRADPEAVA